MSMVTSSCILFMSVFMFIIMRRILLQISNSFSLSLILIKLSSAFVRFVLLQTEEFADRDARPSYT
jgi:hypothetical protein